MKRPLFSVIIPTLNEEKFLPLLLESLSHQTLRDFEVIIVDGKSKDKTVNQAEAYRKELPSMRILTSMQRNLPLQRNLGAAKAKGDWYVFVDADSILMPYVFARMKRFILEEKPQFFSTWCMPDSGHIQDSILALLVNVYWESTVLLKRQVAPGPFTAVNADVFHEVGGYDESHAYNEDVDLGLRLAKKNIQFQMLRETGYIWSMRRIRKEGKMKLVNQYLLSLLPIIVIKRPFKHMPGYVMGGQNYGKKRIKRSALRNYEQKFKKLLTELFD